MVSFGLCWDELYRVLGECQGYHSVENRCIMRMALQPQLMGQRMTPQPIDPYVADEWRAEEKAYVLHTWTAQSQWNAPTVTGGSGAWFWDDQGRRYLDWCAMAE